MAEQMTVDHRTLVRFQLRRALPSLMVKTSGCKPARYVFESHGEDKIFINNDIILLIII